ncbi:MAG: hypothetical protein R2802_09465 [Flavobacteriaceae bacterium]|nr:hypothetical protein [Mangrovimonas sp.]MCB0469632.1 hypothetical protein [Flavobacteriaceae bacterium]MCB0425977.1 hypothetical protein [Mangrovimonas sp.]MCB0432322.1 hypothetical protein [Mangrovimonas sp.]MCB0435312.1 hypothetical protein [Mangrovimonas sp.]
MTFLYFDPGIGAMIVQGIVAAVAGIVLFSKNAMFKVKSFLGLTKKEEDVFEDIDVKDSKKDTTQSE